VGASTFHNSNGLHGLYRENFTFTLEIIYTRLHGIAYRTVMLEILDHLIVAFSFKESTGIITDSADILMNFSGSA
jgi:hypothetical protein